MKKIIVFLYSTLFILVPLVFRHTSSEVFEFNKMVTVYIFTVLIVSSWIIRMISEKRIIFKKTILDIPLLIFFAANLISTITSIDPYTSFFGYYSRFNGGLLSTICYLFLYWSYVSNVDRDSVLQNIKALIFSTTIVSVWAIMEHFGKSPSCLIITGELNVDCWVQDVQQRVFATMGQPNWLAAFLVAVIPFIWFFAIENYKKKNSTISQNLSWIVISTLFFIALLFTKSRSGILAFLVESSIFWPLVVLNSIFKEKEKLKNILVNFLILNILVVSAIAFTGTAWTPSINIILKEKSTPKLQNFEPEKTITPALESGGTESGEIRKIVWEGAIDLWKLYPIFGSGVETFGFAYYETRPVRHNLVSEWDFLYNKAHNEYLNFLATTGTVGFVSYVALIIISITAIFRSLKLTKSKHSNLQTNVLYFALLSGYASILVTNFFGFSVVATSLLFFLYPAIAIALSKSDEEKERNQGLTIKQKSVTLICVLISITILVVTDRYWLADYKYSQSKISQQLGEYDFSIEEIKAAIQISPKQSIYHDQLAKVYSEIAVIINDDDHKKSVEFANAAESKSNTAFFISPRNINIQRSRVNIFTDLAAVDGQYLLKAVALHEYILQYSPTDAKAYYKAGLAYYRISQNQKAIEKLEKAVNMKPNYIDARIALGLVYKEINASEKARFEFEYILKNLDANNKFAQENLEMLESNK